LTVAPLLGACFFDHGGDRDRPPENSGYQSQPEGYGQQQQRAPEQRDYDRDSH
jgi:hypothetical protein